MGDGSIGLRNGLAALGEDLPIPPQRMTRWAAESRLLTHLQGQISTDREIR